MRLLRSLASQTVAVAVALALGAGVALAQTAGWEYPTGSTVTLGSTDNGHVVASDNVIASGTLAVSLPCPAVVGAGWEVGFSEGGGRGIVLSAPICTAQTYLLAGQKTVTTLTLPSGTNYEFVKVQSDGSNFRVLTATDATALYNGLVGSSGGRSWVYLLTAGYATSPADNGHTLSSAATGGPASVTLPSTPIIPNGWTITLYATAGNSITVIPNAVQGGSLIDGNGQSQAAITLPSGVAVISFDGVAFRVLSPGAVGIVFNSSALATLPAVSTGSAIQRCGVVNPGDEPCQTFQPTGTACGRTAASFSGAISGATLTVTPVTAVTNATTPVGSTIGVNDTLSFATSGFPPGIVVGDLIADTTTTSAISTGSWIIAVTTNGATTTVELNRGSFAQNAGVGSGDTISFTPPLRRGLVLADAAGKIPPGVAVLRSSGSNTWALSQSGLSVTNEAITAPGDVGTQVPGANGNCWTAVQHSGLFDVLNFGALPDNTTPADQAFAAAQKAQASVDACLLVPAVYPGFLLQQNLFLGNGSDCLKGQRGIKNWPVVGPAGKGVAQFADLNFPLDTNGVVISSGNGWYVGDIALAGNAVSSTNAVHTIGLFYQSIVEGKVENVFLRNFVICKAHEGTATIREDTVICDNQEDYPNLTNDFPFACAEYDNYLGSGSSADIQEAGAECRAAAGQDDIFYTQDSNGYGWFQMCVQGTSHVGTGTPGLQISCSGAPGYGVPMWRADGIKVRLGPTFRLPSGQGENAGVIMPCGAANYTIWDISVSGGGGTGGTQLYCETFTNVNLVHGQNTITVSTGNGIPSGQNILVTSRTGLPLATKVQSVSGNTVTLTKAPFMDVTGATVTIVQEAVATSGSPSFSRTCQTSPGQITGGVQNYASCGYHFEIRFATPPASGTVIDLQYSDPTGYAGYVADQVSDYLRLRPLLVGGWDVGLKHIGLSDGGIDFKPTYFEILNQCVSIEAQIISGSAIAPTGDVIDLHRTINDPVPDCPGFISPYSWGTKVTFNGFVFADPSSRQPAYNPANYYTPNRNFSFSTVAVAPNVLYCHPTDIDGGGATLSQFATDVLNGGTGNAKFARYYSDQTTGRPGILVAQSGSVSVGASGAVIATATPTAQFFSSYPIGEYWDCVNFSASGPNVESITNASTAGADVIGPGAAKLGDPTPATLLGGSQPTGTTYSMTFSNPFPSTLVGLTADSAGPSNNGIPLVLWRP